MADLVRRLAVARGDEPADLVVRGGRVLSAFTRGWLAAGHTVAGGCGLGRGGDEGSGGGAASRGVLGLAEMMNFPGVIAGDEDELTKLGLTGATHVDGHAPGVVGKQLNAYAAAGIRSDHEARTVEEGRERLRVGMWVLIREASMARNLQALLPLVEEYGTSRIAFCTDDKDPDDIAENGHINGMVRDAVATGIAPEDALVLGSLNPALWHGLDHLGALAPGYQADMLLLPDLESFRPEVVLKRGRPVEEIARSEVPEWVKHTVRIGPVAAERFRIVWPNRSEE